MAASSMPSNSGGCWRLQPPPRAALLVPPHRRWPPTTPGWRLPRARRIQSLFDSLGSEVKGKTIGLGGDGRYYNKAAAQIIIKIAAANGIKKVLVGRDAIMATPAMSATIRQRKLYGESPAALGSS